MHRRHGQAGCAGQVLADLVGQAPRQEADQDRNREQQAGQRRDPARGAPQQRPQGQAEQPGHGQVERAVEKYVTNIFIKLDLPPTNTDHRRVLAVLKYLGT